MSYMWYIHVLVKVNTEERLRANIAPLLKHSASSGLPGPAFSPITPLSPAEVAVNSTAGEPQHQHPRPTRTDSLTDHLILWFFNDAVLARLVDSPPILEQTNGYARVLSDIPEAFREDFCRRIYSLLFDKRVVEWPHGIDVPEPASPATDALHEGASNVATLKATCRRCDVLLGRGLDCISGEQALPQTSGECQPLTAASSPTVAAGPVWMRTPSPSTSAVGCDSEMERGGYFGTVDNPIPMKQFSSWLRSRNEFGPKAAGVDGAGDGDSEEDVSREQPIQPFPSPQQRDVACEASQVSAT